jgi:tetrapyrrole methylase family protein / MazG family protein
MESGATGGREDGKTDLFLVGAGVSFPEHLTIQTIEVLSACARICTNLPSSEFEALPENLRSKCESLWPLYQDQRNRSENYVAVARAVLEAAEKERPVAWMTPGHPFIFDSVSQTLLKAGRARGWRVSVVPAISCIDTILAEVGYDPANGLLVHEATCAVMRRLTLRPDLGTLLLQPSAFGSDLAHLGGNWRPDLAPLRDYVLRFYAPEQDCAFIRSASSLGGRSQIFWTKLQDITQVPLHALAGSTLFLPEATVRRVARKNEVQASQSIPKRKSSRAKTPAHKRRK